MGQNGDTKWHPSSWKVPSPAVSESANLQKSRPTLRGPLSCLALGFGSAATAAAKADEEGDEAGKEENHAASHHDLGAEPGFRLRRSLSLGS